MDSSLLLPQASNVAIPATDSLKTVAHRGYSALAPENTLSAFNKAFETGCSFIEGDFWLTKDGKIVAIHDPFTNRVCKDSNLWIEDCTLEQLKQLDVGSWFDESFAGESIPELSEVLEIVPEDKGIFIEIKCDKKIVPALKQYLENSKLRMDQQIIIAFDPEVIREVKKQIPQAKTLWVVWWFLDEETNQPSNSIEQILHVAKSIGTDGIDINKTPWLTQQVVAKIRQQGLELHVFTVDELTDAIRCLALGVDTITTNRPQALRQEVANYLQPPMGTSRVDESLTVYEDGSWEFLPYRPDAF
ncbi:glycerophosphodiester phosphodiesterase [Pelagibaculum spongiae]|uniref:Glycerophosphodiester phosphodiesterase n=1 Tax=Pelagibaculum spongiae TaxID=2080658 RepID=A0A2V1GT88_9GAMM|nr:glycerophosphodiester phosphodiesterase [Pelagibaculum spongiae]PVZ67596.1 glycerophosphodiester phosphodiesterase [Pelagibaculum spongiae]